MRRLYLALGLVLVVIGIAGAQFTQPVPNPATQPISGTVTANLGTISTAATAGNQSTEITALGTINTTLGSPFQAGGSIGNTAFIANAGTNLNTSALALEAGNLATLVARNAGADPCQSIVKTYTPISITTNTTTRIVAPTSAKKTYICYLFLTSAAADNIGIVEGTGGTCGSSTAGVIGGTTAANGPNFAANGGFSIGNGGYAVAATAGTNVDLCLITSAATPLAGHIAWVQQ